MFAWLTRAAWLIVVGFALILGYRWTESRVAVDLYRQRLAHLAGEYESLRSRYNQAVRKTAVTELFVHNGKLALVIRTIEGVERRIDTPFDPSREIYCDYVLLDGRLWIRRLYDAATPPEQGMVIDPALADIDWTDPRARYGNAVYRSLDEGRWIVTVTGDGSLGLARADPDAPIDLSAPPPVRDYDQLEKQINRSLSNVGPSDVFGHLLGRD